MIGDWFLYATRPLKVDAISSCGSSVHSDREGWIRCAVIQPIPLTPEILEKNGFRLTKSDTVYLYPADRYWWAIGGTRDGSTVEITIYNPDVNGVNVLTKIHTQSSHENGVNTVHSCDIESVHELQHALRMCGVDKEITLLY